MYRKPISLWKYIKLREEMSPGMGAGGPPPDDMDKGGTDGLPTPVSGGDDEFPPPDDLPKGGKDMKSDPHTDRIFSHPDEMAELLKNNPTFYHRLQDLIEKDPATLHMLQDLEDQAGGPKPPDDGGPKPPDDMDDADGGPKPSDEGPESPPGGEDDEDEKNPLK